MLYEGRGSSYLVDVRGVNDNTQLEDIKHNFCC